MNVINVVWTNKIPLGSAGLVLRACLISVFVFSRSFTSSFISSTQNEIVALEIDA